MRREVLGWLIAARSGHGHFAAYHQRFSHEEEEEDWRCPFGKYRAPLHPIGGVEMQELSELCYGRKKLDELYPQRRY